MWGQDWVSVSGNVWLLKDAAEYIVHYEIHRDQRTFTVLYVMLF